MASRRRIVLGAAVLAAGTVAGTVAGLTRSSGGPTAAAPPAASVRYGTVERGDIAMALTLDGALGYGTEQPLKGAGGRVTWLPPIGATVSRGEPLFRADDRPVTLFYGATPLFRSLDTVGLVGRDVKVLADNLQALGYPIGAQPPAGTTVTAPTANPSGVPGGATANKVRPGDAVFTTALAGALRRWQARAGLPPTGAIGPADAVVLPQQIRVSAVTAQLGDDATAPVLAVTGTTKVVAVQVQVTEADAVRSAEQVTVALPDGTDAPGRVSAVSRTATAGNQDTNGPAQLSVTVTLDAAQSAGAWESAPVRVRFAAQTHRGVLVVPIGALLALAEGGYAVQTEQDRLIQVRTGLFDQGRVEVSGDGLTPGLRVVTAS